MAEGITIGYLRHVRGAEGGARIAIFILKNIESAESADNANTLAVRARSMRR